MQFVLKHITRVLERKGIQLSYTTFNMYSLNKFRLQQVNISRGSHRLTAENIILCYSIWRSLFNLKLIGELRFVNGCVVSTMISDIPFSMDNLIISFTIYRRTKLFLLELNNKVSLFIQLVEKKERYDMYMESTDNTWNNLKGILIDHLQFLPLKDVYSEDLFSIWATLVLSKKKQDFPLFDAGITCDRFTLYTLSGSSVNQEFIMDEAFLRNTFKANSKYKTYTEIDDIPRLVIEAIVGTEDLEFYAHHGVNPSFVGYAIRENLEKKKFARGASTITMQLVRNLLLNHDRTVIRKIEECIIALLLENKFLIAKKVILEIYLNLIEFAPDIYGIKDASAHYFGKTPTDLTLTEILVLTYIIPRPFFFHEALLLQTEQLKRNLCNHIRNNADALYFKDMINKQDLWDIDHTIRFASPYSHLVLRQVNKIILHCSATKENEPFTTADLDKWHCEKGWTGVGYHYIILLDGTIQTGRPENVIGAHTYGENTHSVGICYIGGLDMSNNPKDTRTPKQKESLKMLIANLLQTYPDAIVHGHNEFSNKACPCFNVKEEFY